MALTGDSAKLHKTTVAIAGLRFVMKDAVQAAKGEAFDQYQAGFARTVDPWGSKWDPNQDGDAPTLYDTGALASPDVLVAGNSVQIKPERYWVFHQAGANGMARRAVLPFSVSNWNRPIEIRIESVILKQLAKAA